MKRAILGLAVVFLLSGCAKPYPAVGLRPLPVHMMGGWTSDPILRKVDSLRPTLSWEAFPKPGDTQAAHGVTYELRIWRAEPGGGLPAELAYERAGLADPTHVVEAPLAPDTVYLWTMRARFDLDGQERVTPWGALMFQQLALQQGLIPPRGYYPIKTPRAEKARDD